MIISIEIEGIKLPSSEFGEEEVVVERQTTTINRDLPYRKIPEVEKKYRIIFPGVTPRFSYGGIGRSLWDKYSYTEEVDWVDWLGV